MCVGTRVFPFASLAKFFGSSKHSVLVFAQRAEFHLNSTKLIFIGSHRQESTTSAEVEIEEGTSSTDTRWPQPGEKLTPMIDSLNENLMENSFASHKLVWFGSVRFQFLWGPLETHTPPAALPGRLLRCSVHYNLFAANDRISVKVKANCFAKNKTKLIRN